MSAPETKCDECGLPISICNARAMVREAVKRNGRDAVSNGIADLLTPAREHAEELAEALRASEWGSRTAYDGQYLPETCPVCRRVNPDSAYAHRVAGSAVGHRKDCLIGTALAKLAPRPHQQSVAVDELTATEREQMAGLMDTEIAKLEKEGGK